MLSTTSGAAQMAQPMFSLAPMVSGFASSSPPSGAFTPSQIRQAYGFNNITFGSVAGDGTGQTIAIVDAYSDPNIQSDLNTFNTQFGLPATTITRVNQTGGTTYPAADSGGGWSLETALDVEWAHAIAPGAKILLVEANSSYLNDLLPAASYAASHANVVSMSWGGGEFQGETSLDSYFSHAGTTFVASSGDVGAPVSWPAASPNVLAVGGTSLSLGANGVYGSESGWSGSGGGPSANEPQPLYQSGVVTQTTMRGNPDVAYDASPSTGFAVYDTVPYSGTTYGWLTVGGTSAGAPQWAALVAIADQGRALSGQAAISATSPQEIQTILYKNTSAFHDVTTGSSSGNPHYSAGTGYDLVTGLGTPIANLVVQALDGAIAVPPPVTPPPVTYDQLVVTSPATAKAGTSFSITVSAKASDGTTDSAYTGTVHFASSDSRAGLPADYTFTTADSGSHTFTVTLKTSGSQSVTATDVANSAITGTSSGISVTSGAFKTVSVADFPATTMAGVTRSFTVSARDAYGNLVTNFVDTISFSSSNWQNNLPGAYTFSTTDAGIHTFSATLKFAGTGKAITVIDTKTWASGSETGITVTPAAMSGFLITAPTGTIVAGTSIPIVVTAVDAFGNTTPNYTGTIKLSVGDTKSIMPANYTFTGADAGSHTFNVTLNTAGGWVLGVSDTSSSALTGTRWISVSAAPAISLSVIGLTSSLPDTISRTAKGAAGKKATR